METTQEIKTQQEIVKKLIPSMRDEIMVYRAGTIGRGLEKRGNVYKSINAWARGF